MSKAIRLRQPKEGNEVVIPTIDSLTLNKVNFGVCLLTSFFESVKRHISFLLEILDF